MTELISQVGFGHTEHALDKQLDVGTDLLKL
jgi:hypothetical protein